MLYKGAYIALFFYDRRGNMAIKYTIPKTIEEARYECEICGSRNHTLGSIVYHERACRESRCAHKEFDYELKADCWEDQGDLRADQYVLQTCKQCKKEEKRFLFSHAQTLVEGWQDVLADLFEELKKK